jgi:hypothetical protein
MRSVAIIARRRAPVDWMVALTASHTSMKDTGPEATPTLPCARVPCGRKVEKS